MSKQTINEGAVAGHMNHIYDNGEMSFGELKQLLSAAAEGRITGTEKTDGQNIFLSFNIKTGKAVAARNKGQLKMGGLDSEELDKFFSNHPSQALRYSFVEALTTFEEKIKELDIDTQEKIFGPNNDVYYNTEVMNPGSPDLEDGDPRAAGTTNVIPYDKKTLLIHRVGHSAFDKETGKKIENIDVSENFEVLERSLMGKEVDDPSVFSVETNPVVKLPGLKDKSIVKNAIEGVNNLTADIKINDGDTINDYVIAQVKPEIEQLGLDDDTNKMILQRVMKIPSFDGKVPSITLITRGMPNNIKQDVSNYIKSFNYSSYTNELQHILHDFSVAMVGGIESSFIQNNEKQIKFLQDEVERTINKIKTGNNERAKKELERQLKKLKSVENINTPSEGFVFDFNDVTYKFTGNFAPTNQILGMERFQRFGPIDGQDLSNQDTQLNSGPPSVAIVPGAFKPPHKGHLSMVEQLATVADSVLIVISRPLKGGRALPSGKIIDSDHAEQIWKAFLDKSPAGKNTKVMQSPAASPVGVTYDFVMKEPEEGNILVAPENATVILGCGDKEDDKSRYDAIIKKARQDLTIKVQVCELSAKHSNEYMKSLQENPAILSQMPSNKKTTVRTDDFHASDMRYVIDVATQDPIGIEMLKDFVPRPEDALSVLGILGLNPADKRTPEEDQVQEPEIDKEDLLEMINQNLFENWTMKHRPKTPKKASGRFQKNMKRRLSKAHSDLLDQGRHDLTKYGGGFHLPRPKDISNAFLAESEDSDDIISNADNLDEDFQEIEEISVAGSIHGAPRKEEESLEEEEQEMLKQKNENTLREVIRNNLKIYFSNKKQESADMLDYILKEHELRISLRHMILEAAAEDPSVDISDSTGINTLKDLLKNSNVLSTLRNVYKTLTTDEDQKISFRAHIIKWIQDTLAPIKLNDIRPESDSIKEEVGVDIEGVDIDKFIDAPDGSEKEKDNKPEEEEEEKMKPISGADTTGRNKAERIYPTIEKSIIDYYGELDNPEDQEMFYDYLIANMKLYFDKWDGEMSPTPPEEPTNDEYEKAKDDKEKM